MDVLRWSALAVGVFYGFSHQRTITATQRAAHEQHEYEQKQKLIDQAKAEFAKQKNPQPASQSDGMSPELRAADRRWRRDVPAARMKELTQGAVITDVENPKFDLEKYLMQVAKDSP
ncbi:beta-lactamase superfamily domain-containing protein [Purpureocillium lavendulum]|uniref:ATP synthase F(0) complex subunit e, mitochondrial n=1 Tax=Purpureocillium lavendulum TaxID=1247861 RepID=A0AB34G4P3_9HYPO|nr:beta-lactamase superfamily domain-containing protein [Purpureocillium lavendulum]